MGGAGEGCAVGKPNCFTHSDVNFTQKQTHPEYCLTKSLGLLC